MESSQLYSIGEEMKNICFFSGDITRSGGTERVSSVIANELTRSGKFHVCFLSLWEKNNDTFFPLEKKIKRYVLFNGEVNGKKILTYIKGIKKFIGMNGTDILIDIDGILDMYSIPAVRKTKCKVISWEQFNYYQNPYVSYRKYTRKLAAKKADAIVVLTDEDKRYYQKEVNVKGKLVRIYNPIEKVKNNYLYNLQSKTIISAGRLVEQKGFDMLVDVAKLVFAKHNDWQWIICGEGENRTELELKIEQYGLAKNVILKGNVNNIQDYYKESALYVLTSRYEGFGLVLTEAKNLGLPCVSFQCPAGPSEIIENGINGYLIKCFDIQEMADKINVLIENVDERKRFSENALIGTEKFDLDKIVRQWEELLLDL